MAIINWEKELSVNITELDEQHKKLIDIINDLHNAMLKGKSRDILDKVLDNLIDYTKNHFRSEEILFEKYNYPDYLKHKKEHDDLVKQVLEIQEKYKSGKKNVFGFFVGQIMKETKGKANPKLVNELLKQILSN